MASMASVPAQSLECAICQELYIEPKQLSCTHTFCQNCLAELHDFNIKEENLICPVCRQKTQVEDGDVSKLQTNYPIKSLVEDIKSNEKMCTASDHEKRSPAVAFCQTCGVYMCSACLDLHGKWKSNENHGVVKGEDINNGKMKVKQLCKKHPQEEMEWACSTCKVSICFRCRMLYHNGPNHEVEEVAEFQKALREEAEVLQKDGEEKINAIKAHIERIAEATVKTRFLSNNCVAEVVRAYNESVEKLAESKNDLVSHLLRCREDLTRSLCGLHDCDMKLLHGITSNCELVGKGATGFLEGESLVVHQRLCEELREMMSRACCNDDNLNDITDRAERIKFNRYLEQNELQLGEIDLAGADADREPSSQYGLSNTSLEDNKWNLKKLTSFSISGAGLTDMAPTPGGKMAVGYMKGGVDLFSVDGVQETVLKKTSVLSLGVLSDGRYAILEPKTFSLYSPQCEKVSSSKFNVHKKYCLICVGSTNEIFVCHGNSYENKMYQFRPDSGKLVKDYEKELLTPDRAIYMSSSSTLVLSYGSSIQVLNEEYKCTYAVDVQGSKPCPVVLEDDSILVGCVSDGTATVELYTKDLRFVRTVLQGFKLHGCDFVMSRFVTGEIAICDSRYLHIFQNS